MHHTDFSSDPSVDLTYHDEDIPTPVPFQPYSPGISSKKRIFCDYFCNSICVIGLCLIIIVAIIILPLGITLFVSNETYDVVENAEMSLRERGLAALRNQVANVQIPPFEGSTTILSTTLDYSMDNFTIISFLLNDTATKFSLGIKSVSVDSNHDQIALGFDWWYQEGRVTGFQDSGYAVATSSDFRLVVEMAVVSLQSVKVTDCNLNLTNFDIQFHGSTQNSLLYNAAIRYFQDIVTSEIEEKVCKQLKGKVFDV